MWVGGGCVRVCLTDGQTKRVCCSRHEVNNRFERNQRFFVPAVLEEKRKKERTWERTPTLQSHSTRSINRPDWSRSLSQLSLYPLTLLLKHASSHTNTHAHASKHTHTHSLSLSLSLVLFCWKPTLKYFFIKKPFDWSSNKARLKSLAERKIETFFSGINKTSIVWIATIVNYSYSGSSFLLQLPLFGL